MLGEVGGPTKSKLGPIWGSRASLIVRRGPFGSGSSMDFPAQPRKGQHKDGVDITPHSPDCSVSLGLSVGAPMWSVSRSTSATREKSLPSRPGRRSYIFSKCVGSRLSRKEASPQCAGHVSRWPRAASARGSWSGGLCGISDVIEGRREDVLWEHKAADTGCAPPSPARSRLPAWARVTCSRCLTDSLDAGRHLFRAPGTRFLLLGAPRLTWTAVDLGILGRPLPGLFLVGLSEGQAFPRLPFLQSFQMLISFFLVFILKC